LICEVYNKVDTETHTVFLANVLNGDLIDDKKPMTYHYYHNVIKGNSPKAAPSYVEPQ
jgi:flavin reductase (DIM6/NTAB) family NADH-FMN oxidoreductase RutF